MLKRATMRSNALEAESNEKVKVCLFQCVIREGRAVLCEDRGGQYGTERRPNKVSPFSH